MSLAEPIIDELRMQLKTVTQERDTLRQTLEAVTEAPAAFIYDRRLRELCTLRDTLTERVGALRNLCNDLAAALRECMPVEAARERAHKALAAVESEEKRV